MTGSMCAWALSSCTLALLFVLALGAPPASALRTGGSSSGGTSGGTSSGSGSSSSGGGSSSTSTSKYSVLKSSSGEVYTGSRAYRGFPITGVSSVAFYGPSRYNAYSKPRYNDSTSENCTLCPGISMSPYSPPPPAGSALQGVVFDGEAFQRSLPSTFSNFDDWNSTVYDISNGTCWVQNCTLTDYGSGTSSAACHRPWTLAAMGLLLMLGSMLVAEMAR